MTNRPQHPAVVLAMTATGLAAARALHRRGVSVFGVDAKRWEVGHHSSEVRRPAFAYEPAGPRLVEALVEWARTQAAPPVLIPADDAYTMFLASHHEQLRGSCLIPDGYRPEVAGALVDKRTFYRRCESLGVDVPTTLFPEDLDDLEAQVDRLRFPVILNPAHGHLWRKRFHGKKVLQADTKRELIGTFRDLGDLRTGMTVQEVIPGPEREIFVCGAYFREGAVPQALFTARKSRQYPPGFGSGSLLLSEWKQEIADLSIELIGALGYSGICGTEYKPDPRDGRWKLIEVNPRPTLWFSLCRAAGCDVVYHAYADLIGERPNAEIGSQRDGVRWQYVLRDLPSLAHYLRRREAGWSEVIEALSPLRKDEAIASWSDLRATFYYLPYGLRQWLLHRRGEHPGP